MKSILSLLLTLVSLTLHAQDTKRWLLGSGVAQVKDYILGEPGYTITKEGDKDEQKHYLNIARNDSEVGYNFYFLGDVCVEYRMLLRGVHKEDFNARFSDLEHTKQNDWIDHMGNLTVYIHRSPC